MDLVFDDVYGQFTSSTCSEGMQKSFERGNYHLMRQPFKHRYRNGFLIADHFLFVNNFSRF